MFWGLLWVLLKEVSAHLSAKVKEISRDCFLFPLTWKEDETKDKQKKKKDEIHLEFYTPKDQTARTFYPAYVQILTWNDNIHLL